MVAAVRDPTRHQDLAADRVTLRQADVTDGSAVAGALHGADAAVHAVSPFSGPEQGFATLDPDFFVKAADVLLTGLTAAGGRRLVVIGLFATLPTRSGGLVMDDPAVFPPEIRPFAQAHLDGLTHLRAADTSIDWLMLTPPAGLSPALPRTGKYRIGAEEYLDEGTLSYADLAVAVVDEIERPAHRRVRLPVYGQ